MIKLSKIMSMTLFLCILCATSILLRNNWEYYAIPNGDFFQYIGDGHSYVAGVIPKIIHPPPLNPILYVSLSKIVPSLPQAELIVAKLINATATIAYVGTVGLIIWPNSIIAALLTMVLMATNMLLYSTSFALTSETLFSALVVLTIYLWKRHPKLSLVLASAAFYARYEGIVLVPILWITDFIMHRPRMKMPTLLFALIPIMSWLLILNFHSEGASILHNTYLEEIKIANSMLPQTGMLKDLSSLVFGSTKISFFFLLLSASMCWGFVRKNDTMIVSALFLVCYIAIHLIFPFHLERYNLPILWVVNFLILYFGFDSIMVIGKKHKSLKVLLCIVWLIITGYIIKNNIEIIEKKVRPNRVVNTWRYETRLAINWLNQYETDDKVSVLSYEPEIISYFNENQKLEMMHVSTKQFDDCRSITCIIMNTPHNQKVLVVKEQYVGNITQDLWAEKFGKSLFSNFPQPIDLPYIKNKVTLSERERTVTIYELNYFNLADSL